MDMINQEVFNLDEIDENIVVNKTMLDKEDDFIPQSKTDLERMSLTAKMEPSSKPSAMLIAPSMAS